MMIVIWLYPSFEIFIERHLLSSNFFNKYNLDSNLEKMLFKFGIDKIEIGILVFISGIEVRVEQLRVLGIIF